MRREMATRAHNFSITMRQKEFLIKPGKNGSGSMKLCDIFQISMSFQKYVLLHIRVNPINIHNMEEPFPGLKLDKILYLPRCRI